ncbi:MAG: Ig-like domain-containing protein [Clostridia bacterium]|nr:Ig-like domain-containing protein [Clostridia bacterium]
MKKAISIIVCVCLILHIIMISSPTAAASNPAALSLLSVSIKNKQENVRVDTSVILTFNKNVSQGSNYKNITITSSNKKTVALKVSISKTKVTIKPNTALQYLTDYILTVPANSFIDASKKPYAKKITITFKTTKTPVPTKTPEPNNTDNNSQAANSEIEQAISNYEKAPLSTVDNFINISSLEAIAREKTSSAKNELDKTNFENRINTRKKTVDSLKANFISNNIVASYTEDSGTRISSGNSPYALVLDDGRIRLYYGNGGNIESAISSDGINFTREDGIRVRNAAHPTVVKTPQGKYRMYYGLFYNSSQGLKHKLASAISDDGLNFVDEGVRIEPEDHYATYDSAMEAVQLPDGSIRVYVITDNVFNDIKWKDSTDYEGKTGISSLISTDGLKFTFENGKRTSLINFNDPSIAVLSNGYYWIITSHPQGPLSGYPYGLHGFVTKDGLTFSQPKNILPQASSSGTDNRLFDPSILKVSNDTYRVYYGQGPSIKSSVFKINTSVFEIK